LNHRLVQMCLRLLRAEIWSQGLAKKLNRFTARMVPDAALQTPAVLIHGRLLVLGGDSQRIHEEIILAGGQIREGRFSRMNVSETQAAAAAATNDSAPGFIEDRLKELWAKVEAPLIQSLEARMQERTKNLQKFLDERSEREVANVTAIMQELERSIRETLNSKEDQLQFDWSEPEKQQRERDFGSLRARLAQLPAELASGALRIATVARASAKVPAFSLYVTRRGRKMLKRLHVIGGKNHGKTSLIVELVWEFSRRGITVGTIKHTHHQHELDVPGKDFYRHREAGAKMVGILSPSMTAMFLPTGDSSATAEERYSVFAPMFARCRLVLVEGDSQTTAPKIEVWRNELGTPPLAMHDKSIMAVVTDDACMFSVTVHPRSDVEGLANWILPCIV
jgi:molybdopterin-guanine dinucleotide biosynthesis protein MobB